MSDYGEGASPPPPPYGGGSQGGQFGQPQYGQQPPQYGQQPPQYGQQPPQYGQQPYGQPVQGSGAATPWGPVADPGQRFLAYLLDSLISGAVVTVVYFVGLLLGGGLIAAVAPSADSSSSSGSGAAGIGVAVLMFVLWAALVAFQLWYFVFSVAKKGATFGKQIIGLKIVNENTGGNLSAGAAFLRLLVLGLTGSLCFIGYFSMFFDSSGRSQGWHDKAVGSLVIRTK